MIATRWPGIRFNHPHLNILTHGAYLVCLVGMAVVCYLNTFDVPFHLDDYGIIVRNTNLRDLSQIRRVMSFGAQPPRPLVFLSLGLNYHFSGLQPFGYHLVNLALHILNGILVYAIALAIGRAVQAGATRMAGGVTGLAACTAFIFVSHPIQTEAVTYISGRSDVLCTLFYLLALWCFIWASTHGVPLPSRLARMGQGSVYGLALLAFLAALASKAIALSLPLVLLAYDFYFISRSDLKRWLRRLYTWHAMFIAAMVARCLFYLYDPTYLAIWSPPTRNPILPLRMTTIWEQRLDFADHILTHTYAMLQYLKLFFWPVGLNIDHDIPVIQTVLDLTFIVSLVTLLLLIGLALALYRRSPVVSFGISWFFLTLALFFVLPLPDLLVERRLYLPSVGLCLGTAFTLGQLVTSLLANRKSTRAHALGAFVPMALVLAYSATTIQRNHVWREPVALWQDAASKSPNKVRPLTNLAAANLRRGDYEAGVAAAQQALRLMPDYGKAHYNLLDLYVAMAQWDEVFSHLYKTLEQAPAHAVHWAKARQGHLRRHRAQLRQMLIDYERAISTRDQSGDGHLALGLIYLAVMRDGRQALVHLEAGMPLPTAHFDESAIRRLVDQLHQRLGLQ